MPGFYNVAFSTIEIDKAGRVILPMFIKERQFKILFDNGSSIFPLLVTDDKINAFSTLPNTDTIKIKSWGNYHNVIGRLIPGPFQLAGQPFPAAKVYADYRKDFRTNDYDGLAGNALFWDKTIIIDFKDKKFGIK